MAGRRPLGTATRRRPAGVLATFLAVTFTVAACDILRGPTDSPATPHPTATEPAQSPATAIDALPCAATQVAQSEPQPYTATAPQPPDVPGAGGPDEEVPNENERYTTPVDPAVQTDPELGPSTEVGSPGAQQDPQPTDVVFFRAPTAISKVWQIAEPNIAASGGTTLMTWNKGAARTLDGDPTPRYLDPWKHMLDEDGNAVDGGFCCDQLTQYIPELDLWIWVLQSETRRREHHGGNRIRLFMAKGDEPFSRYWDLRSQDLGEGVEPWFDQPKVGTSRGHLFLTVNAYEPDPVVEPGEEKPPVKFITSLVVRMPLEDLAVGATAAPECFTTTSQPDDWGRPLFSPIPVRRADDVMYLGAHTSFSTLAVWRWPDDDPGPTLHRVMDTDANGREISYPYPIKRDATGAPVLDEEGNLIADDYKCQPDGAADASANWCERSSDRVAAAWHADGQVGFAWSVGQDDQRPYPSTYVLILDEARLTACAQGGCVVAKPYLRNAGFAFQHAAIGVSSRGELGIVVQYGGGSVPLSCAVGVYRPTPDPNDVDWQLVRVAASDRVPPQPWAGDYLNVWPGPTDGTWMAGCMTLQSANGLENPSTAHFTWFGRRADLPTG